MKGLSKKQEDDLLEESREAQADLMRKNEDGITKFED